MNTIKVVLATRPGKACKLYLDAILDKNVSVDTVHSFSEMREAMIHNAYNGALIDLPLFVRSPRPEKDFLTDLVGKFPIIQLNYDFTHNEIHSLFYGKANGSGKLSDFLEIECKAFHARKIRSSIRKPAHLSIRISPGTGQTYTGEKTATLDISPVGCFIISSFDRTIFSEICFTIQELEDQTPITGQIRRVIPWGNGIKIPGYGVAFTSITDAQRKEICERFHLG